MTVNRTRILVRTLVAGAGAFLTGNAGANALPKLKRFVWSSPVASLHKIPLTSPNLLLANPIDLASLPVHGIPERIRGSVQRIGPAIVQGSWIRVIESAEGTPVFRAGEVLESIPTDLPARVAQAASRFSSLMPSLKERAPRGRRFPPRLEVIPTENGQARLEWVLEGLTPDETGAFEARYDESGSLIALREAGVHLEDGLARVFPKGPRASPLSDVILRELDGTGTLSSLTLSASSARSDAQVTSPQHHFEYSPEDPRFDQVQAYFFADRMMRWLERRFAYEPEGKLEVKVQVGERSNTAFYFHNQIRLGEGDGVRYHGLARDPSVVMHEVVHAVVDRYAKLSSEGEGGGLNEAFADFFAASFLENPNIGEAAAVGRPYARTLKNTLNISEGLAAGPYTAAQFIGGTLWDLREALGHELGEGLAYRTMTRLGPSSLYADFAPTLLLAAQSLLDAPQTEKVKAILRARGWTVP